jgi:tetratricopeptide (TPR) repeat protein
VENEPAWLQFNHRDGWSRHCWTLAIWRNEAKSLPGNIETRLLRFVLGELRRDLESRQQRNRVIYNRSNSYYWVEKEADFVKTAEEVLAQHGRTSASVEYIAEYLYRGTFRLDRAIAALLAAQAKKILYEGGQAQLVRYLHEANRFAESIPLLVPLVAKRPDNLDYRVWLMRAYFKVGRPKDLLALLKDTDAFFHKDQRWTEGAMASLGQSTLDNQLFKDSVAYYKEAIDRRQKTQPTRGIGDGTLSGYYANQARAYSGQGMTPEAVEAAISALVAWGRDQRNRKEALVSLLQVLRESRDLQGYVAFLDKKEQETKLHNPVVRKALGQVLAEKGKHREAVAQLQLAAAVQPNDAQTYELLLTSLDKLGDKEGTFRALLQAVQLRPREISLYRDMGRRLESLDRPREVERAYTSIVEMQPNEAESHALLAEVRQQQNRWGEAIVQWGHAARLRALEPDGLLKLAAAQVHERQWDQAAETVRKLRSRGWPSRFSNVEQEIRHLEQQIADGRRTQS